MSAAIPTYPSASATTASTSVAAASAPSAAAPLGIGSATSSIRSATSATHVDSDDDDFEYPAFAHFARTDPSLTKALVLASSKSENPDYKALAHLLLTSLYSKRQTVRNYFDFGGANLLHMHTSFSVSYLIDDLSSLHQEKLAQYLLANHKQKLTSDMLAFLLCWRPQSRHLRTALTTDKEIAFNMFAAFGIGTTGNFVDDSDLAYSLQQLVSNKNLVDAAFRGYLQSPVYLSNWNNRKTFCDPIWLQFLEKNKFSDLLTKYKVSAAPASAAAAKPPDSTLAKK